MSLLDRLVFGTARLAGGAYATESRALIEDCLAAGIRRFDTAPAYGMGAAEGLIGEVTAGDPRIAVHTKAGLARPSNPALRGWGKRVKALAGRDRIASWKPELVDYSGPAPFGDYNASSLAASIERSRWLLRRDRLDLLLLHAAEPADIAPESWAVFEQALANGTAAAIGFAHPGPARTQPPATTIQVAPRTVDFTAASAAPRIYHSVRTAEALARPDESAAGVLEQARAALPAGGDTDTRDMVAAMTVLAGTHPDTLLIFATTSRARLRALLDLARDAEPVAVS